MSTTILQHQYVLAVPNVRESARFYVDALGFSITADHPGWIFVSKDACTIMLGECPDDIPPAELGSHSYFAYLNVNDVDGYHQRLTDYKATIVSKLENKPWGMREFGIKTLDGHRIMLGQRIST